MGWRIKFTNILQIRGKFTTQYMASRNYFDSDMYNSTNTVVYILWWERR